MPARGTIPPLGLKATDEHWPIAKPFTIARGSKQEADVLVVSLFGDERTGRGEAVPYARYGESMEGCIAALHAALPRIAEGIEHSALFMILPAGAARNALDCALWDWRAKASGEPVWALAGLPAPEPVVTAYTISLGAPAEMAEAARKTAHLPLLKIKLGDAREDAVRLEAVRRAAPRSRLIVDANEGWRLADLERLAPVAADCGVEVIEQPLPADADACLAGFESPVPLCADESFRDMADFEAIAECYDAVNLKLDKAGGLSNAIALAETARASGLDILLGSMVATSLAVAPALLLASRTRWVDLDGPLLLARDRTPGLQIEDGVIIPTENGLWGTP